MWFCTAAEHGPASSLGNFQRATATAPSRGGGRGATRFHSSRTGGIQGQVQLQMPCASLPCGALAAGGLGPPPALCPRAWGGWEGVCPAQDPRTALLGVGVGPGLRPPVCSPQIQHTEDMENEIDELLQEFEEKSGRAFLHTVCFY